MCSSDLLRMKRPAIGGFYIVHEDGSEGFLSAVDFEQRYTLDPSERERDDAYMADEAKKAATKAEHDEHAAKKAEQDRKS